MSDQNVVPIKRQSAPPNVLEGQLLGAVLDLPDPLTMFEIAGFAGAELSDRKIGVCWDAGVKLAQRGRKVNAATVFSIVRATNMVSDEARDWLRALQAENMLVRESFAQVADDLRRQLLGRAVASSLEAAARELRSGNYDAARVAADLETANFSLLKAEANDETAASDVLDLDSSWTEHERLGTSPLRPTGIKLLDETIKGAPPNLIVVAAQPGVGKNMLLSTWIRRQLETTEDHFGLFALEDGSSWLTRRWTAQDLGMPLNMIGHGKRTQEQLEKLAELNPHYHRLLERLHIYRFDDIRPDELVHRARGWIHRFGVKKLWIDHLGHLDHSPLRIGGRRDFFAEKRNEQVTQAVRKFASLAYREEVPVVALAHTVRPEGQKDDERPPRLSEIAESAGIERRIRCAIGLWRTKSRELRCTILKNTEGPGVGTTIELEQFKEAATIDHEGGRYVNLDQEHKEAKRDREEENEAKLDARARKRADKALKLKLEMQAQLKAAEEAKPPPPQLTLLEGGDQPKSPPETEPSK